MQKYIKKLCHEGEREKVKERIFFVINGSSLFWDDQHIFGHKRHILLSCTQCKKIRPRAAGSSEYSEREREKGS